MDPTIGALAAAAAVALTAICTWLVAHRKSSGKIATTEAATLWVEGAKMRDEWREEALSLRDKLAEAITAISELNTEIRHSRSETEASREETRKSRAETRHLMEQIENVHSEIKIGNDLKLGELADNQETRRILAIPKDERTPVENVHVATAPNRIDEDHLPKIPAADRELSKTDQEVLDDPQS